MIMITFTENAHKKQLIAEGGEGRIYLYKNNYIIKIFKDIINKKEKLLKIKKIMSTPLPKNVITPVDLVYDSNRQFIGYSMKKVQGEELSMLASRKFIKTHNITKKDILTLLTQINTSLIDLHDSNIFIGDLSDLNILFDGSDIYFIDIDSWSVGSYKCTVANDAFKDPALIKNYFNAGTDVYAFAIMVYKCLTRLHPFGGSLQSNLNMGLRERMVKKLTAIGNKDVKIPRMVDKDVFMPLKFRDHLKTIFTTEKRDMLDLYNFYNHLTLCPTHNDYFYSMFNKCPVCENDAKERQAFTKIGMVDGIPVRLLFTDTDIKIIYNELVYLTHQNLIMFRNSTQFINNYEKGSFYGINHEGDVFYKVSNDSIRIKTSKKVFDLDRKYKSEFRILDNDIYYISNGLYLTKFSLLNEETTYSEQLEKVSINNVFDVQTRDIYFICNSFDNKKIINISGYNYELDNTDKIVHHAIHYDLISKTWLFIFETSNGRFITSILDKKKGIIYLQDDIRYIGNLNNMCYHNKLIYKPSDGSIVRFNYKTNEYKEFTISIVSTETKLLKKGKKFTAINEKEIYEIG